MGSALDEIFVGQKPSGSDGTDNLLAELALWGIELSTQQKTDYLAGIAASGIAASDLAGYWPMDADNATQSNLGVDATGDLTVTSATFDADHPTITSSSDTSILVPTGPWY